MLCHGPDVFIKELFMYIRHVMPSKTQKKYHDTVEIKPLLSYSHIHKNFKYLLKI